MCYEVVLFDLDGTLTDPKEGITKSIRYALDKLGIAEDDDAKLTSFIGPPLEETFLEYGLGADQVVQAVALYRERFEATGIFENKLYPGVNELLRDLKSRSTRVALTTSKPAVFAERILVHFGIRDHFDVVAGSELDGTGSNKAEVIAHALTFFPEVVRNRVVMVGDRKHDIIGARANGLDVAAVLFGYGSREEIIAHNPTYVVDTMAALYHLLVPERGPAKGDLG